MHLKFREEQTCVNSGEREIKLQEGIDFIEDIFKTPDENHKDIGFDFNSSPITLISVVFKDDAKIVSSNHFIRVNKLNLHLAVSSTQKRRVIICYSKRILTGYTKRLQSWMTSKRESLNIN